MSQTFNPNLNDPDTIMASLIELESLFVAFYGCIKDILNVASNEQTTVQALAESIECGEMWQAILRRQVDRNCLVECLVDFVNNGSESLFTVEEAEEALKSSLRILTDDGLKLLDIKRKLGNAMSQHDSDSLDEYMLQTAARNDKFDQCKSRIDELDQSIRSEFDALRQRRAAGVDQQTLEELEEQCELGHRRYGVERLLVDVEQAEIVAAAHELRLWLKANLGTWRRAST